MVHSSDRGTTLVPMTRLVRDTLRVGPQPARRGRARLLARRGTSVPDYPRPRMTYAPPRTATSGCPTAAAGGAASSSPRSRSASGRTSAATGRSRRAGRSSGARSTSAITHFDLANNYGPPYGSAEENFGRMLRERPRGRTATSSSSRRRPATTCGRARTGSGARASTCSRASTRACARMGLEYVDIFYSHRFDPETPLEETMGALDTAVRQGKALYAGISSYSAEKTREARARSCATLGTPLLIHQPSYSMLNRWIEPEPARRARRARRRLHRVLAARPGDAHRPVPRRDPGGLARQPRRRLAVARPAHRRDAREDPRAERDRRRPRPDARADGARLDAPRRARDLDAGRRLERRAARGERRARSSGSTSPTTSSPRSTATRPTAASTSGPPRAASRRTARRAIVGPWRCGSSAVPGSG